MQNKNLNPASLEIRFFSWVQFKQKSQVNIQEVESALGLTKRQVIKLLSRLSQNGLIIRLKKGIYLVPKKLPAGGRWGPNKYWVLQKYMDLNKTTYQISGPDAFNKYGYSDQVPFESVVYNTKFSRNIKIGQLRYQLIKVSQKRIGSIRWIKIAHCKIPFSSPGRTLMDALYDWSRFNTIPNVFNWILKRKNDKALMSELVDSATRFGNISTRRRLGYILESEKIKFDLLIKKLKNKTSKTQSFIAFNPNKSKKGKINTKWGIIINDE